MSSTIQILSGRESAEWASLQRERDPELRADGLLHLAGRLERRGREAEAASIYQSLIAESSFGLERARQRLEVLQGGGPFGAQAERLLGHFSEQVRDPALLFGMGVAGSVASLARLGFLARLSTSSASLATRGFGARFFAGVGALALEAPAFTLSQRLANSALGRGMDSSAQAWGRELASGYLMLGSFRISGALMPALGLPPAGTLAAVPRLAANLGALMSVHRFEAELGWRPHAGWAASAVESLATLVQLHVAGRLSRGLWGRGMEKLQREAELRAASLDSPLPRRFFGPRGPALAFAGAGLGPRLGFETATELHRPRPMAMVSMENGGANGNGNGKAALRRAAALWAEWNNRKSNEDLVLDRREASYASESAIPAALDQILSVRRGRPVLVVQLDIEARSNWPQMAVEFLLRNPAMEEIIVCDPYGEGWWAGRPPLGELSQIAIHSLGSSEFRARRRHPTMILGLTLRDSWQGWSAPPPIAEYLKQARLDAGLSVQQVTARLSKDPSLARELQSYRMRKIEDRHIQYAENAYRLPVAFPLLLRLARIYRMDPRRFILSSNLTLHPDLPRELWSNEHYPLYLESEAEVARLRHFDRIREEGRDPRRELSWLLFSARKNPERYRRIPDLATEHRLTQSELAAWELGEGAHPPSLAKMTTLAEALNLPLDRVIHATNRTFFPQLDLENLFPGQAIPIDTRENDVAMIQTYAENPGTPGQYVFAARKRLADHPGRSEWSRREGLPKDYLYERENNRVRILPANLGEWSELFRRLNIPNDVLRILAKVHGKILMSSPEHIFAEGSQGRSLQSLVEQTGISSPTLSDAARLSRATKPATLRDLKAALPDLDAAALYIRAHPEIVKFFPEAGNANGPQPLELTEEQVAQAQRFHLGSALYRFRHDPPQDLLTETSSVHVDMATLANRLGVTKQTVSAYESIFVRIEDAGVLERAADLLGLDRRMLYLHFNPEILDIFSIDFEGNPARIEAGSAGFLKEANRFYDRSNLRRRLFAEVSRIRGPQRMESAMKPRDVLASTLGIDRPTAAKYLGEGRVLEVEDIRRLSNLVPALDYRQWFEHFNRAELAFFLGTHPDGSVDFRPPEDLPRRVVAPIDQLAVFLDRIEELGLSSRYGRQARLESTILAGGRLRTSTLLQLSFNPGLDRRWLYFHFRRPELEPILTGLPNF